jgi:hypothetical protein
LVVVLCLPIRPRGRRMYCLIGRAWVGDRVLQT